MARLKKEDWLSKGLSVLSTKGYNNLRLEYLCKQLKVTRGSFYHHFEDINDYIDQLMGFWESRSEDTILKASKSAETAVERLNNLQGTVFNFSAKLEVVIRGWASFNPVVLKYVKNIDNKRIQFIADQYIEQGIKKKNALAIAKIEYAAYIGVQNLYFAESKKEETAKLYRMFEKVLIRYGKQNIEV